MNKQLRNVLDTLVPAAPPVAEFLAALRSSIGETPDAVDVANVDTLFAEVPTVAVGKPRGSVSNEMRGAQMALAFQTIRENQGAAGDLNDLDEWMTSFAKFFLRVELLFDEPKEQEACLQRRKELAPHYHNVSGISCGSFRTHVNGLFRFVKEHKGPTLVATCGKMFPKLNDVLRIAIKRFVSDLNYSNLASFLESDSHRQLLKHKRKTS